MQHATQLTGDAPLNQELPKVEISFGDASLEKEKDTDKQALRQTTEAKTLKAAKPSTKPNRLPEEQSAVIKPFATNTAHGYFIVGLLENNIPHNLIIHFTSADPATKTWGELFARSLSLGLEQGVPLQTYLHAFTNHTASQPGSELQDLRLISLLFAWLKNRFEFESLPPDVAQNKEQARALSPE